MRRDNEGNIHSLDVDISELWKSHNWKVVKEEVKGSTRKGVWIITAIYIGKKVTKK